VILEERTSRGFLLKREEVSLFKKTQTPAHLTTQEGGKRLVIAYSGGQSRPIGEKEGSLLFYGRRIVVFPAKGDSLIPSLAGGVERRI